MKAVFVDTDGWMACADRSDPAHLACTAARDTMLGAGRLLITTDFVVDETLTLIRFRLGLAAASAWWQQVDSSAPHSEEARIVERYTLGVENGRRVLTNEWTMTDPLFLTAPMTGTKRWSEMIGGRLLNYECAEPQWYDIVERLLAGETIGYQGE